MASAEWSVVLRHADLADRCARRMTRFDPRYFEDVRQEALLHMYRYAARFDPSLKDERGYFAGLAWQGCRIWKQRKYSGEFEELEDWQTPSLAPNQEAYASLHMANRVVMKRLTRQPGKGKGSRLSGKTVDVWKQLLTGALQSEVAVTLGLGRERVRQYTERIRGVFNE